MPLARRMPLVAIAAAGLALATFPGAVSSAPGGDSPIDDWSLWASSTITDSRFDVIDGRADVLAASTSADDGVVVMSMSVASYATPAFDAGWSLGLTGAVWEFDTDLDGFTDFEALLTYASGRLQGRMYLVASTDIAVCDARVAQSDAFLGAYGMGFDSWCIGDPGVYRWRMGFLYDGFTFGRELDQVPDWGWSNLVFTDGTAPIATPPVTTPPVTTPPVTTPPVTTPPIATPAPPSGTQGPGIVSIDPVRVFDSRATGRRGAGSVTEIPLAGKAGLPRVLEAGLLNVTVNDPRGPGYVTVFPCGSVMPEASNLNYVTGETIPNAVLAKVGASGSICVFTSASSHLLVDVNGYVPSTSTLEALSPIRVLDTRSGPRSDADATTRVRIDDVTGVAQGARAVFLNLTAVDPAGSGYLTVYPCDRPRPGSSHLNFVAGQTIPNAVLAKVSNRGEICIYSSAATDLIVDVNGIVGGDATLTAIDPTRIFDSRGGSRRRTGSVTEVPLTGLGGVPGDAGALMLNVTVTDPADAGYITVYPCGTPIPEASNLNVTRGQTIANAVLARPGASGAVCVFSSVETHVVVDVNGYDR